MFCSLGIQLRGIAALKTESEEGIVLLLENQYGCSSWVVEQSKGLSVSCFVWLLAVLRRVVLVGLGWMPWLSGIDLHWLATVCRFSEINGGALLLVDNLRLGDPHNRSYSNIFDSLVTLSAFGASTCLNHVYFLNQSSGFLLSVSVVLYYCMNLVPAAANPESVQCVKHQEFKRHWVGWLPVLPANTMY